MPLTQANHLIGLPRGHTKDLQNDVVALCRSIYLEYLYSLPLFFYIVREVNLAELALGYTIEIYGGERQFSDAFLTI